MPNVRSFTVLPSLPDSIKDLELVSRNMLWLWDSEFVNLFKRVDSKLWDACGHNPVKLLGSVSQEQLDALASNKGFVRELGRIVERLKSYLERPSWFEKISDADDKPIIAYFSAEFGIHECLPVYSGGLGVLAGDHLKSASDLGIPLVGVGLLYQKGYFRQYLNIDGWQQEVYVTNDFYNMPVELVKDKNGQPVKIKIDYPEGPVVSQVWCVSVGRVKLYLLDTNLPENSSRDKEITSLLYGGDLEMRIRQEIMLGIGGLRALKAVGITPTVCHMNEGHAAFMALERIRQLINDKNMTFDEAMEVTKSGNVFTVHTPVKAGNDEFSSELIDKYFKDYIPQLRIDKKEFMALGRVDPDNSKETFKMPVLAIRFSSYRNGVSKLHGKISRQMWSGLWPDVPLDEVPITSITNGTHLKSWLSEEMSLLYERYLGSNWDDEIFDKTVWDSIDQISAEELWRAHQRCKERLVAFARKRLKQQVQRRGTYHAELNWVEEVLDPEILTIGFARRFATYKRGNLLLMDPKRLMKILNDSNRPVQIIFAGKAHPRDTEGKEIIRQIIHFATQNNIRRRIVFLEDYDINVARYLVRGVDVWLNNPRPPMEASGTSGMKAAFNGALNLSTWDGWWCEGYIPEGGWIIGSGETYDDTAYQDMVESQAIYNLLENEIVPLFYTRSPDNLPRAWIHRMRTAIKWITPRFCSSRMASEYTKRFYNPANARWHYLIKEDMRYAKQFLKWKAAIKKAWSELAVENVKINVNSSEYISDSDTQTSPLRVGDEVNIEAVVNMGRTINPDDVSVEFYYGTLSPWGCIENGVAVQMQCKEKLTESGKYLLTGLMPCKISGQLGLVIRVLPKHPDLINPCELGLILWESPAPQTVKC